MSPKTRKTTYISSAILLGAVILATLVTFNVISVDHINNYFLLVVSLIGTITGFVANVLAALNTPKLGE